MDIATASKNKRPNIFARLGNFLLLLVLAGNLIGLMQLAMHRESVLNLSNGMNEPNQVIMGSRFLDIFLHPATAILLGLILVALIVKEFILKRFRKRVLINIGILVVLMVLNGALVASYSAPIKELGTTSQPHKK